MFVGRQKRCQFHDRDYITDNVSLGQNWQVKMLNYAQNSSRFKDGSRLDFRRLPGPVLILPEERLLGGMSAGSFSRTAAGNRA